jgi:hypothetical protein
MLVRSHAAVEFLRTVGVVVVPLVLLLLLVSNDWLSSSSSSSVKRPSRTIEFETTADTTTRTSDTTKRQVTISGAVETAACSRRQAAILLFGRLRDRADASNARFENDVKSLTRVRDNIDKRVIQPNSHLYNFTIVVRVEDPADEALVRVVFQSENRTRNHQLNSEEIMSNVVLATNVMNQSIEEPSLFFCKYRMWSNIQVAVQALRTVAASYLADRLPCFTLEGNQRTGGDLAPEGVFDWVLVFRSEIVINTPFVLSRLSRELFYVANFCAVRRVHKKRVYETAYTKKIRCLPNEITPIVFWRKDRVQPRTLPPTAVNRTVNNDGVAAPVVGEKPCKFHTLACKKLMSLGRKESTALTMPDYYFAANATTMSNMFYRIVDDWHEGKFRKAAGHCNHGLLGGRLLYMSGTVRTGRYKYHKIDFEIPRHASWYPVPSLVEYLAERGALWDTPNGTSPDDTPVALLHEARFASRCNEAVCLVPELDIFN